MYRGMTPSKQSKFLYLEKMHGQLLRVCTFEAYIDLEVALLFFC